jgi:hypothetical protein
MIGNTTSLSIAVTQARTTLITPRLSLSNLIRGSMVEAKNDG